MTETVPPVVPEPLLVADRSPTPPTPLVVAPKPMLNTVELFDTRVINPPLPEVEPAFVLNVPLMKRLPVGAVAPAVSEIIAPLPMLLVGDAEKEPTLMVK